MKLFPKKYHPPGTPPGTLVSPGGRPALPVCHWIEFEDGRYQIHEDLDLAVICDRIEAGHGGWVRVQGQPSAEWMSQYGNRLGLHPLAQEDVLNSGQRPKLEPYDGQIFMILNVPRLDDQRILLEQVSLFRHRNCLVSFSEGPQDPFSPLVLRLRDNRFRLLRQGLDYLLYALVDSAIDHTFPVLESIGDRIEDLEDLLVDQPEHDRLEQIHQLRREIILLNRGLWPHREVLAKLLRNEDEWLEETVLVYLRDCYDHTLQLLDTLKSFREMSAGLLELYLSSASIRLNDVMRVLTVIATIFMPLTFVVGVYGMNFRHMPELEWRYGYPAVLIVCAMIALMMLFWFRRKGWF